MMKCAICHETMRFDWKTLPDKSSICFTCYNEIGYKPKTLQKAKQIVLKCDQYYEEHPDFVPTQKVGRIFGVDERIKEFLVYTQISGNGIIKRFRFDQLIYFDLLENGVSVRSGNKALSSFLHGKTTGSFGEMTSNLIMYEQCNSLQIKILVRDSDQPIVTLQLINDQVFIKNTPEYNQMYNVAQIIMKLLQFIFVSVHPKNEEKANVADPFEEIKKFKELLDLGILTSEEFEQKKKELFEL